MEYKISKIRHKKLRHIAAGPFIWGMFIPIVFLDITAEIYHRVAFPLYGIEINKRRNYIRIDRQKLSYLSTLDKISCMYCGYANGVLNYTSKIAGDTEKYWCSIKHKENSGFIPPEHHKDFLSYNDKDAYDEFLNIRQKSD